MFYIHIYVTFGLELLIHYLTAIGHLLHAWHETSAGNRNTVYNFMSSSVQV